MRHENISTRAARRILVTSAALLCLSCLDRGVTPADVGGRGSVSYSEGFPVGSTESVDILIVVDDSISMSDKQDLLRRALPSLFSGVVCVWDGTNQPAQRLAGECPAGSHGTTQLSYATRIGLISSSLDAAGSPACATKNRHAHLIPPPLGSAPFLDSSVIASENLDALFSTFFASVGEEGCGYEAPLEALYRFLVDPSPPATVRAVERDGSTVTLADGVDEIILRQRREFLRPQSAIIALILTDEDDCSTRDDGSAWMIGRTDGMPRATSSCKTNPNDMCCRSCGIQEAAAPSQCVGLEADPECQIETALSPTLDAIDLRCFDQKRRFGLDLLFPMERYVRGFSSRTILDRDGRTVENPLFAGGRDPSMVYVGAIVGVPWQAIATPASLDTSDTLAYLSTGELASTGRWESLLGNPAQGTPPQDPHLVPSIDPRSGLPGPQSPRSADPIHGHEYDNPLQSDLQYACTFELESPKKCEPGSVSCDCAPQIASDGTLAPTSPNRPLCQAPDGSYGTTQYFAKAYPPTRILQVLQALGDSAFLGSICPKVLDPVRQTADAYGFNAILRQALNEQVARSTGVVCIPDNLPVGSDGRLACRIIEHGPPGLGCDVEGRRQAQERDIQKLLTLLHLPDSPSERTSTFCEIEQLAGDPKNPDSPAYSCSNNLVVPPGPPGFCYIDPARGFGDSALVSQCAPDRKRRLRLVPANLVRKRATLRVVCDDSKVVFD